MTAQDGNQGHIAREGLLGPRTLLCLPGHSPSTAARRQTEPADYSGLRQPNSAKRGLLPEEGESAEPRGYNHTLGEAAPGQAVVHPPVCCECGLARVAWGVQGSLSRKVWRGLVLGPSVGSCH